MISEITYEEFLSHMDAIKAMGDFQDEFSALVKKYGGDCFMLPEYIDGIVNLLSIITEDKEEWIGYYVFETDFGRASHYGGEVVIDGKQTKLETIEDLWKILNDRNKYFAMEKCENEV